jgi:hypothetical protein
MKQILATVLALSACLTGFAQDRTFLPKPEVEALVSGKKWTWIRPRDGSKIYWDLRSGGNLFANNRTSGQSDAGTWLVNDEGQLCLKWRGSSGDGCYALYKDGDKLKRVGAQNLKGVAVDVEVE